MEGLSRARSASTAHGRRRSAKEPLRWFGRLALRLPSLLRHTTLRVIEHDCPNVAQSAAYSAMIALFPALIVAAAVVTLLPYTAPVRYQLAHFFYRVLPSDVTPLLETYFAAGPGNAQPTRAILPAAFVSLTGASSVIATLMEGFRRAYDLPEDAWGFWKRRIRAFALVPLSLIPFGAASVLVVFGHLITEWLATHLAASVRTPVFLLALVIRWAFALLGSVGVIALIYHLGTPAVAGTDASARRTWHRTLPGAAAATGMWFVSTLGFGWYVTRYANYSKVYGSLGAGIALLFWLYIVSLSVLCGAEFNAQLYREKTRAAGKGSPAHGVTHG